MNVSAGQSTVDKIKQLSTIFLERAEQADRDGPLNETILSNIHHLQRLGFFGAGISQEYGGLALSSLESRESLKLIASSCGVTAFTQQQLHAGGNFVGRCEDEDLKKELLPQFASGENICGVGFSHLRRSGPPIVKAVRTASGFTINGRLPWISAWSILNSFILGATVNDGRVIFCYLPIKEFRNSLFASAPMKLLTMEASETVELELTGLQIPSRYVLSEHGPDHMVRSDFRGITGHTEMPLGCALGSASFIRQIGTKRQQRHLMDTANLIDQRAQQLDALVLEWNAERSGEPEFKENALQTRVGVITLAVTAASAAIAAVGGSGHLYTSPAQRRFRESAFYMTQAQTPDIQHSLLEALLNG